jgi:hypothetical protein
MNLLKYLLPTLVSYIVTVILYKNFIFFKISFGTIWINIAYYWLLFFGVFFSILNVKFNIKNFKIISRLTFFLCFLLIIILSIDSVDNLKDNSILSFLMLLSGIQLMVNFKYFNKD